MATIKTFQEIVAWQKAHELTLEIYAVTRTFPKYEEYALANQMRRCSVSVPSNIAEGYKRKTLNDRLHFYCMAESSLEELKYQLLLAKDLHYIAIETYQKLLNRAEETGRTLCGWKNSQR